MKLRTLLCPALIGVTALALPSGSAGAAPVTAPPGGSASAEKTFEAGNAPVDIDIVRVRVRKTTDDYRATVTYADLRPRPATRWFFEFTEADPATAGRARTASSTGSGSDAPVVNIVELRRSPSGRESSFGWKVSPGEAPSRSTCSLPQRAVADDAADTITFIVPRRCWKPTTGAAYATAYATESSAETWDGTTLPDLDEGKSDLGTFSWFYRPETAPR